MEEDSHAWIHSNNISSSHSGTRPCLLSFFFFFFPFLPFYFSFSFLFEKQTPATPSSFLPFLSLSRSLSLTRSCSLYNFLLSLLFYSLIVWLPLHLIPNILNFLYCLNILFPYFMICKCSLSSSFFFSLSLSTFSGGSDLGLGFVFWLRSSWGAHSLTLIFFWLPWRRCFWGVGTRTQLSMLESFGCQGFHLCSSVVKNHSGSLSSQLLLLIFVFLLFQNSISWRIKLDLLCF